METAEPNQTTKAPKLDNDFCLTNDKIRLSSDIKAMEWCPTMDLIALLTSENVISIYRFLTWQKLFSITNEDAKTKFSCIAWRPDGNCILIH
jgi:hypothetical protein